MSNNDKHCMPLFGCDESDNRHHQNCEETGPSQG